MVRVSGEVNNARSLNAADIDSAVLSGEGS